MLLIAMGLCAVIGVALFVLGINYVRTLDVKISTLVFSFVLVVLFSLLTYFALRPLPIEGVPSLTSVPFGFLARLLLLSTGLPSVIAYLIGFVVNFLALVGAVRLIQKRSGD